MSKEYHKGYVIGYLKAVRDVIDWMDADEGFRLYSFVGWLKDTENEYIALLNKTYEDATPKSDTGGKA